jgi:Fe-Mn family superoxide dismutase
MLASNVAVSYPAYLFFLRLWRESRVTIAFIIITNSLKLSFSENDGAFSALARFREDFPIIPEVPMSVRFTLAPLPWDEKALAPVISANTIAFHYHKHHQTYVDTLNKLVEKTKFADMKLEEIVRATASAADDKEKKIFNNAAQVWNHDFYWRSLTPSKTEPGGKLASAIARDFGEVSSLIAALAEAGQNQFGSGWAWLVSKEGKLAVEKTADAQSPMAKGINCLLALDVWEHAYYLDYQNARPKYLEAVLGKILNWDYAAENLDKQDHAVRAAAE